MRLFQMVCVSRVRQTTPVLVGSIAGARWSASEIVTKGHPRTEILRRVLELSEDLGSQWIPKPSQSGDLRQPQRD